MCIYKYIYICTCDSCIYKYVYIVQMMYVYVYKTCIYIYIAVDTWYTKIAIKREKTLPFPKLTNMTLISPWGCTQRDLTSNSRMDLQEQSWFASCPGMHMYVLPYMYDRIYNYLYIYIHAHICICMCRHATQPLQQEAVDTVQRWLPPFLVITSAQDRMPIGHMISCWLYIYYIIIAYDHIVILPLTENVVKL